MEIKAPNLRKTRVGDIKGLHPAISPLGAIFSSLFLNEEVGRMTKEALKNFVVLHPIQLVKQGEHFVVVGGLRSYQLTMAYLQSDDRIPSFIHTDLEDNGIKILAETDILVSRVAHGLGAKPSEQLKKLTDVIGKDASERLLPGVASLRGVARLNRE
jgi:hypothetical protein